jgi:hypothetical protein
VIDGHPATPSWISGVNGIDTKAILEAAQALVAGKPVRHLRAI